MVHRHKTSSNNKIFSIKYLFPINAKSRFYFNEVVRWQLAIQSVKYTKSEDKGLSFLCFIHYFLLISVTFLRKTALLCSLMDAETAQFSLDHLGLVFVVLVFLFSE